MKSILPSLKSSDSLEIFKLFKSKNRSADVNKFYRMMTAFSVLVAMMLSQFSYGQVASYSGPAAASNTYTNIAVGGGTTTIAGSSAWDDANYTTTLPFAFSFNNIMYASGATINISSNGFITFGAGSTTTNYTAIQSSEGYAGAIAGLSKDLGSQSATFTARWTSGSPTLSNISGTLPPVGTVLNSGSSGIPAGATVIAATGTTVTMNVNATATQNTINRTVTYISGIHTKLTGSGSTQKFSIQWTGADAFIGTTAQGSNLNFQIVLNQTTNAINFIYGVMSASSGTSNLSPQVGLRGASNADFFDLSGTNWAAPTTTGNNNASIMTLTSSIAPASGQTYTFTPPAAAPILTATTSPTSVDNSFTVTYPVNASYQAAITSIKIGAATLVLGTDYTLSGNNTITFTPSAGGNSSLRTPGTYTITVNATGYLPGSVSQQLTVGAPAKLVMNNQPTGPAANGGVLATQPSVFIRDQYGNATTSTASVTAAPSGGTWTIGGGTNPVAAINGTATFSGLTATSAAPVPAATITFSSAGLTSVTSNSFNIPGAAPVLSANTNPSSVDNNFTVTYPTDATYQSAISTGNIKIGAATLVSGTDYTLSGNNTITFTPSAGGNSSLRTPGTYTITVNAANYNAATVSQTLTVGAPAKLVTGIQPTAPSTNGGVIGSSTVNVQDKYGNATTSNALVTATVGSGAWTIGGTISVAAVNGTATFNNLTATSSASVSARIIYTSSGLTQTALSNAFTIPAPTFKSQWISMNIGASNWCQGETRNITVTVKNVGTGTWSNATLAMNVGAKWDEDGDYGASIPRISVESGNPAGPVTPGETVTYTFQNVAASQITATNKITFDIVREGICWFASSGAGSCDLSNVTYSSSVLTINAAPTALVITPSSATICNGNIQQLSAASSLAVNNPVAASSGTIGDASGNPFRTTQKNAKTQFIYTASALTAAGLAANTTITSISFDITSLTIPINFTTFSIGLGHTTSANFSSTSFITGLTTVYSTTNQVIASSPSVNTFTFTTPFLWNGTGNIVFDVCWSMSSAGASSATIATTATSTNTVNQISNTTGSSVCGITTGTRSSARPFIALGFSKAASITWSPTTDLYTDAAATIAYTGAAAAMVYAKPTETTAYNATAFNSTCTSANNVTINVNQKSGNPASATASNNIICNGQSTTLTLNGGGGGTVEVIKWYSTSCGGTAVGTGNNLSVSPTTTTTYYGRYEDGAPCNFNSGCASVTITVNQKSGDPSTATASASPICSIGGSSTLTLNGGGGVAGEVIHWYSGSCGGTSVGTGNNLSVSPTSTTTYFGRYENVAPCNYNSQCASVTVTVTPAASATITYAGNPFCSSMGTALVSQNGTTGGTYSSTPGLSINPSTGAIDIGISNSGTYTVTYTIGASGGCGIYTTTTPLTINDNTWLGTTDNNWNDASNWSCGSVPNGQSNVYIPSGAPNQPLISSTFNSTRDITIQAGASLTTEAGTYLTIIGSTNNNGTLANYGKITLNGTALQTFPGASGNVTAMTELEVDNTSGVSLNHSFTITGVLTPTTGNLALNNNYVTLASDSIGVGNFSAARVAALGAGASFSYGTGGFVVERYYHAKRAWRLTTAPIMQTGSPTIFNAWQLGGAAYSPANKGRGEFVTGPNPTAANGLDPAVNTSSSLKTYNTLTGALIPVGNTKVSLSPGTYKTEAGNAENIGYFNFVRGDRNPALVAAFNPPATAPTDSTTLSDTGRLQTGTQTFTFPLAVNSNVKFILLPNPYASPIDFASIYAANTGSLDWYNGFTAWDPEGGGPNSVGQYVVYDGLNKETTPTSPGGQRGFIQSTQAVYVQTTNSGTTSIVINESDKSDSTTIGPLFRPLVFSTAQIAANLKFLNADNSTILADGVLAQFSSSYSDALDAKDAFKFTNVNENFGLTRNGKLLTIERRNLLSRADTLFLDLTKASQRSYQLEFIADGFSQSGFTGYLEDSYLKASTPLNLSGTTTVNFSITADAGSQAKDRFRVVFRPSAPLPVTFTKVKAYQQGININVEWIVGNEMNMKEYELEKSADGSRYIKIVTLMPTSNNGTTASYYSPDVSPFSGANYYRIHSVGKNGESQYSNVVSVIITKGAPQMMVYPNPVMGGTINLQMVNQPRGTYNLRLINKLGQVLLTKEVNHEDGSSTETLQMNKGMAHGMYQLEVTGPANNKITTNVIY